MEPVHEALVRGKSVGSEKEYELEASTGRRVMVNSKSLMSTLQKLTASEQNKLHRGPKSKTIKDRILKPQDLKPIRRPECSWSQWQKIRLLVFLYHHRIMMKIGYRNPTQQEASDIYGVPQRTIRGWVRKQEEIELSSRITHSPRVVMLLRCLWPELESRLYHLFLDCREQGQAIRTGWFRIHSLAIFRQLFPNTCHSNTISRFSNGWFRGFIGRYRISL